MKPGEIEHAPLPPRPGRKPKVYWRGAAEKCDICALPIEQTPGTKIVDGRTRGGPWALMHTRCHAIHGVGTGTGRGQVYERQPDDAEASRKGHLWLKIEG